MEDTAIAEYKAPARDLVARAKELSVRKYEDVMDAADFLLDVKTLGEKITSRKEEITKPLNDGLKSARALFKPLEEQCAEAEKAIKDKVLDFHFKHWKKDKETDNTISGLRAKVTVVAREAVNITDSDAIPPQFCSPDPAKVLHALKAGIEVPGAELVANYSITSAKY